MSKNGSISFFFYAGCPEGAYRVQKRVDFFFSVVATNRYINLFIKLSPLLLGMYCSDCLQQKQAKQNPFLSRISRERGSTHPYFCDVKASFDLFINLGLNWWRHIVNMLWTQMCRFKTENKQLILKR